MFTTIKFISFHTLPARLLYSKFFLSTKSKKCHEFGILGEQRSNKIYLERTNNRFKDKHLSYSVRRFYLIFVVHTMGDASARASAVLPIPRRDRGPKLFHVFDFKHNAVSNT